MNSKKKKILIGLGIVAIILIVAIVIMWMYKTPEYEYTKLEDGTWELSHYWGEDVEIEVPSEYRGKPVTRIGDGCFVSVSPDVIYYYIPDTVTSIGEAAFHYGGIKEGTKMCGAHNVHMIEEYAFGQCSFAGNTSFITQLTEIGKCAFVSAKGLEEVVLNEELTEIPEGVFRWSDLEDIMIGSNITYIGNGAFTDTPWLAKHKGHVIVGDNILIRFPENEEILIVPDGVKLVSVSEYLSNNVKEIYISRSVEKIEKYLLSETNGVTIYVPSNVKQIGNLSGDGEENISYSNMDKVTMVVEAGSYAEEYAKRKAEETGLKYQVVERIEYPSE